MGADATGATEATEAAGASGAAGHAGEGPRTGKKPRGGGVRSRGGGQTAAGGGERSTGGVCEREMEGQSTSERGVEVGREGVFGGGSERDAKGRIFSEVVSGQE